MNHYEYVENSRGDLRSVYIKEEDLAPGLNTEPDADEDF